MGAQVKDRRRGGRGTAALAVAAVLAGTAGLWWWSRDGRAPELPVGDEPPRADVEASPIAALPPGSDPTVPAAAPVLRLGFRAGDVWRYEFDQRFTTTFAVDQAYFRALERQGAQLIAPPTPTSPSTFGFAGSAVLRVYLADPSLALVGWQLADCRLQASAAGQVADRAGLEGLRTQLEGSESLVRCRPSGQLEGIEVPASFAPDASRLVRSLVVGARFVFPDTAAREWTAEETDLTGVGDVTYACTAIRGEDGRRRWRIIRERQGYREAGGLSPTSMGAADEPAPPAVRGRVEAVFDPEHGRFESFAWDEQTEMIAAGGAQRVTVATTGTMRLVGAQHDPVLAAEGLQRLGRLRAALVEAPLDGREDAARLAAEAERARQAQLAAGATAESLAMELRALAERGDVSSRAAQDLWERLVALLALDAEQCAAALALARGDAFPIPVRIQIADALSAAGTEAAQVALAALTDAAVAAPVREAAARGLGLVRAPTVGTERVLRELATGDPDAPLTATAMLGLGINSHRLAAEPGPRATDLVAYLGEQLARAPDSPTWRVVVLEALGNARADATLEAIRPHLEASEALVRGTAYWALRGVAGEDACALLRQRLTAEADEAARVRAAEALAFRDDDHARTALAATLLEPRHERVRRAALSYFIERMFTDPSVRVVVETVAARDPSAELRALARDALAGR